MSQKRDMGHPFSGWRGREQRQRQKIPFGRDRKKGKSRRDIDGKINIKRVATARALPTSCFLHSGGFEEVLGFAEEELGAAGFA
jgi:hypothetical protein